MDSQQETSSTNLYKPLEKMGRDCHVDLKEKSRKRDEVDSGEEVRRRDEEAGELEAAEKVINAMLYYRRHVFFRLKRQADAVKMMRDIDRALLYPSFPKHMESVRNFADANQKIFDMIVNCGASMLDDSFSIREAFQITQMQPASEHYMSKARSILKQIVRDWSADGAQERASCYSAVLNAAEQCFPDVEQRHEVHCLVAGAGLARLAWEMMQKGFTVMGNEFSLFMLITSNFILNACHTTNEFVIYPYLLDFSNSWTYADQLKAVQFPDVNPSMKLTTRKNKFSMCAGDFLQAFDGENDEQFDCFVSVFFIDTATNPIDYIRRIYKMLKPGGVWLNFGPLTYHFDDAEDCVSLELPFDELMRILPRVGFRVDEIRGRGENPPAYYANNTDSMLQYTYYCGFFRCTKPT